MLEEEEVLRREGKKKIAQQKKIFWKDTLLHLIKMHFLGKVKSIKKVDFKKWMSFNFSIILSQFLIHNIANYKK